MISANVLRPLTQVIETVELTAFRLTQAIANAQLFLLELAHQTNGHSPRRHTAHSTKKLFMTALLNAARQHSSCHINICA